MVRDEIQPPSPKRTFSTRLGFNETPIFGAKKYLKMDHGQRSTIELTQFQCSVVYQLRVLAHREQGDH